MKRRKRRNHVVGNLLIVGIMLMLILGIFSNIRVQEDLTVVRVGEEANLNDVDVTIFGMPLKWPVSVKGEVDTSKIGRYEVVYTPFLTLNSHKVVYSVVDITQPKIELVGPSEVIVENLADYQEEGCIAIDNYDGDLTQNVVITLKDSSNGEYLMEYSVHDSSNNTATVLRTIKIVKGRVALTFDDGPSYDITPQVLDVLKEHNIKATFFLVKYDKAQEGTVKRMHEEGHTIGLHGYSHKYAKIYTSIDALMENFTKIEELISETTGGYNSKIIRFPGGASNTVSKKYCKGIMSEAVNVVEEHGYIYYDWNVDSGDAGKADTAEEIYNNVISGIRPGRLNVVLMHDSGSHNATLEALEMVIEYCKENNYVFEAITQDTKPVIHHGVSN